MEVIPNIACRQADSTASYLLIQDLARSVSVQAPLEFVGVSEST